MSSKVINHLLTLFFLLGWFVTFFYVATAIAGGS